MTTKTATQTKGPFLTEWEYNSTQELSGKTYHVWECKHTEGYTAFALTHQPSKPGIDYIKPIGTGHFVGAYGLERKTGLTVSPN